MSELVKRYTSSVFFDKRLWQADIAGQPGARRDAGRAGHHRAQDHADIQRGMAQITQPRSNPAPSNGSWTWKTCT
jgi:argininosuccinate lyase